MKYSLGFKESMIKKLMDGSDKTVYQVAKESGLSPTTLQSWIQLHRNGKLSSDDADEITPSQRGHKEKLSLLLDYRSLPDDNRGEWLRTQGLHSEHISLWEQELQDFMSDKQNDITGENKALKKQVKELQYELARKDKALAEAAVLITLKKNYLHLFENRDLAEES